MQVKGQIRQELRRQWLEGASNATTPGGGCAYTQYVVRVPLATIGGSLYAPPPDW